jgi:hypothetical protein
MGRRGLGGDPVRVVTGAGQDLAGYLGGRHQLGCQRARPFGDVLSPLIHAQRTCPNAPERAGAELEAGWVQALAGSNPASSAAPQERPLSSDYLIPHAPGVVA